MQGLLHAGAPQWGGLKPIYRLEWPGSAPKYIFCFRDIFFFPFVLTGHYITLHERKGPECAGMGK